MNLNRENTRSFTTRGNTTAVVDTPVTKPELYRQIHTHRTVQQKDNPNRNETEEKCHPQLIMPMNRLITDI